MSGGHFDYIQYRIEQVADQVEAYIRRCEEAEPAEPDEFGYKLGYSPETISKFKECEKTLRKAADMLHRIDWLASGDDGEETFHERWEEDLNENKYSS